MSGATHTAVVALWSHKLFPAVTFILAQAGVYGFHETAVSSHVCCFVASLNRLDCAQTLLACLLDGS